LGLCYSSVKLFLISIIWFSVFEQAAADIQHLRLPTHMFRLHA